MQDAQLVDRARVALASNPHLSRKRLRLESRDGRLKLEGVVDSYYQKQMAQEALRRLDNVGAIDNLLEVHW